MPWEETEEFIRSGHRDPDEFEEGSLRTITLSEEEGIKAVIGKPKGETTTEVQSYLFAKDKGWTLSKAKAWFEKHREGLKVREHVSAILPFKVLEKIVDKPLKIRGVAITAGSSRNFNIYAPEELQAFTQKLVSAPVYIEHVAVPNAVGKVTKTEWDGSNLWYEAEIYDDETAEKIRKGLIQHVSVGADYETIDVLDGKVPHGLHNAELSLVAVPGIPETNVQIMEGLQAREQVDIQEPAEYILGFYQDPNAFMPEHFAWAWLDRQNGVLAVVGRPREQPETKQFQAIFFAKEKAWDEAKIKDWLLMHPDYTAPAGATGNGAPPKEREKMSEQIKPEEGESHEDFMKRCLAADNDMERCAAAWKQAHPGSEPGEVQERVWTRNYINNLNDSCFAVILPGGEKDEEGKTVPRNLRKFPYKNRNGKVDLPHLRNANARVPQSDIPEEQKNKAMAVLGRVKKKLGIGLSAEEARLVEQAEQEKPEDIEVEAAEEPTMDELITSIEDLVDQINDVLADFDTRIKKLEQAQGKGAQGVAESLLKNPKPTVVMKEAVKMIEGVLPSPMVERSWGFGPQRLCQELRGVIRKLEEAAKSG